MSLRSCWLLYQDFIRGSSVRDRAPEKRARAVLKIIFHADIVRLWLARYRAIRLVENYVPSVTRATERTLNSITADNIEKETRASD
jgi:hypothetical protein